MILGVALLIIGGIIIISFYNSASVLDDYCFSCTAKTYGFWESQKMYYQGWSGRYFSTFYYASNPLVLTDSRIPFIIFPILLLLSYFAAFITLAISLFHDKLKKENSIILGLLLGLLFFVNIPKVSEALFWYSGTYTFVSIILTLFFFKYWYIIRIKQTHKKRIYALLIILYIAILGSSEISMIILSGLVFIVALRQYLINKKVSNLSISLIVLSVICSFLVITAPGNSTRHGEDANLNHAILRTLNLSLTYAWQWISTPSFLFSSIAYLWFANKTKISFERIKLPISLSILLFIFVTILSFFPSTYGLGADIDTPGRILNLLYFIFFIGWFYILTLIAFQLKLKINVYPYLQLISLSLILMAMLWSPNVKYIYRDIRFGTAKEYLKEVQARRHLLKQDNAVVFLEPISARPYNIFIGDISENHEYLWNTCLADYYGKESVIMLPNID
jgi:hypothetical protein